jgi:tight adherence protein C
MNTALMLGAMVGIGLLGVAYGLRVAPSTLESLAGVMSRPALDRTELNGWAAVPLRTGRSLVAWGDTRGWTSNPRWQALLPSLAITGESPEGLAVKVLVAGAAGLLVPLLGWMAAEAAGISLAPLVPVVAAAAAVPAGVCIPFAGLVGRARDRRRHFRIVIGSFVDLVVLSLAGGVGVEGSLLAASVVSEDWAARRMARALSTARDGGQSPWAALGRLGTEIGVPELLELSTTLELAGTEGSRIRQSLTARAVSLRRHEQADAESAANAVTERLFLPGALLLVGFLLFIGYPAFSRVIGGF